MRLFKIFSILIILMAVTVYFHVHSSNFYTLNGKIFGTYYNIKINTREKDKQLENKIKDALAEVNHTMSVFDPRSEISTINQASAEEEIRLSEPLQFLLKGAELVYHNSNGAFDPTVGPLVNLWGFGISTATRFPSDQEIAAILPRVGFNKLKFSNDYKSITKHTSETFLDLSAIAKGYAVDRVAAVLDQAGYHDYIVEIGGEVKVAGTRDGQNAWTIGIATPGPNRNSNAFSLDITDYSVATSGDYRNFFFKDGKRYSHTISPFSGKPVESDVASVTVFDQSCMMADAYATAIVALGEKDGMALAEAQNLPVIMFIRGPKDEVIMHLSSAARNLIGD